MSNIKSIQFNEDGNSIKGCSYIYAPKGQALEYSELAANVYRGCAHACAYCYVPNVLRMKRSEFNAGAKPRTGFIAGLSKDAQKYASIKSTSQIMLSFTSDPYHPGDNSMTRATLEILKAKGLHFCTLTKGGTRSIRDLDLFDAKKDSFGTTLTTLDDDFSKKWEPGAALPEDRIKAIKEFSKAGIFTWASLEPTLNTESSKNIILETHEFIDLFKIGRANYLPMTKTIDWEKYTHDMIEICQKLGVKHYIKKDLQKYLPKGYHNPLRIQQHF